MASGVGEVPHKYPRTPHLADSRLQPGDHDLPAAPLAVIAGRTVVIEEKIDGANAAISFDEAGLLRLQSRGHFLTGGPRERQFGVFKSWAAAHQASLRAALGTRYVLYGEWVGAKHTVFYDALPHYFLAFDILDRAQGRFLDTPSWHTRLADTPVARVPILYRGIAPDFGALRALIAPSLFKTAHWREALDARSRAAGLDPALVRAQTDRSDLAEGLYIKVEVPGETIARYKYVRADFLTAIAAAGDHWLDRPPLPNGLTPGVDLYAPGARWT